MIDVYYYQSGQFFQAVASATGEDSARGHVGQCLLLQETAGVFVTLQRGVSHFKSQCSEFLVGGYQFIYFFQIYCP